MTLSWCVGGKHKNKTTNQNKFEEVNPRTKNSFKLLKELVVFVVVINHKFLLSK